MKKVLSILFGAVFAASMGIALVGCNEEPPATEPAQSYSITLEEGQFSDYYDLSSNYSKTTAGTEIVITVEQPVFATVAHIYANEEICQEGEQENTYTFTMPSENVVVTADFEILPDIKIGDFSKISLDKFTAEVPAEEVDKAVKYLAETRKESVKVDGKKAAKGDIVMIDFVGSVDGVEFNGGKGENYPLELGSGAFIPGFEDQLIGAEAGSKVDVKVKFPADYHAKDLADKDAVFAVTVKEVREPKAVEINDDLAKSLGAESLAKLKETLASRIKADYDNASRMKLKRQLLDILDKEYKFEVPASLVDAEYKAIVSQYEQAKKYNQLDAEEKSKKEEDLLKEYKDIALRRVKLGLVLSEVGQNAKISIKPEDINAAIMNEAKRYPGQEQMVLDYYLKNKHAVEALKAPIFEEKIIDYIISQAKLNEKVVSVEELYKFDDEKKESKKAAKKSA